MAKPSIKIIPIDEDELIKEYEQTRNTYIRLFLEKRQRYAEWYKGQLNGKSNKKSTQTT